MSHAPYRTLRQSQAPRTQRQSHAPCRTLRLGHAPYRGAEHFRFRWRGPDYAATLRTPQKRRETGITLVTTTNDLPGYRVIETLGLVRGVIVRSRSALSSFGASIQSIFGGNITVYTKLAEDARRHAYDSMVGHAAEMGGNAVIGARYDANEITDGITEVLAYGTAVRVERGR